MRLPLLIALSGFLAAGCSNDSPLAVTPPSTEKLAWIGTYAGASSQGDIVVDLARTGSVISGEIALTESTILHVPVSGTASQDSIFLNLDPARPYGPADFSLRARVLADGSLSGTMNVPSATLSVDLSCRALPRLTIDSDVQRILPFDVFEMVFDGSRLWLSSSTNYVLMLGGAFVDTVVVYHEPSAQWVSTELMFDGALVWGVYPITIIGPGGSTTNVADLLAFNDTGRTPDSLRINHRPAGLAYDGVHGWSLRADPRALIGFDRFGAVTDSLRVGIPDAYKLSFDGAHFWTVGWNLRRLYKVALNGEVLAMCDLPNAASSLPAGLAAEGSHIWYVESSRVLHRLTIR